MGELSEQLEELSPTKEPNDPDIERLRGEIAVLEDTQKAIDAVKAREEAAFKLAKKAAEEVKKEVLDATYAANQPIFDEYAAKIPARVAEAEKDLASKMPAETPIDDGLKQKIQGRVAQEAKLEAQHALKPLQAKFFDEVVKKRNLPAFDLVDYRVDWESVERRIELSGKLGHKPDRADYERFVHLNTTLPRLLVGQMGGVFPDPIAKAHYIYVMREVRIPEAASIDPLRYRIHRKYFEMIRRNQVEAMFSHAPIIIRHKLFVIEAQENAPQMRPPNMSPGGPGGAIAPGSSTEKIEKKEEGK
jgi:hypothetical protein